MVLADDLNQNGLIRLEHVAKRFREGDQERKVLQDVTASMAARQIVTIVGKSGSGKSTLLNLIAGLDLPSAGEIWIGDACISAMSDRERTLFRRDHIGFVFQFFNLIPTLTAIENVLLTAELSNVPGPQARERATYLLDRVDLLDRAAVFPDKLSGGEQQRIAIARALCSDPPILLADEPTGNLDADTGAQVFELLLELARERGKTLIVVTHSTEIARAADRVLKLDHGHLIDAREEFGPARLAPAPSAGPGGALPPWR